MRNSDRNNRSNRQNNFSQGYRNDEGSRRMNNQTQSNAGGRGDWYDRDPMDDRSGYRDEDQGYSRRMDSGDVRGHNDHYRYDQIYHNYYGSTDYNPDRERDFESRGARRGRGDASESERYSRGQGAYGTTSSGRASWDSNVHNNEHNRWNSNDDYTGRSNESSRDNSFGYGRNRDFSARDSRDWNSADREMRRTSQGSYGSYGYSGPQSSSSSSYGYGTSNFGSDNQDSWRPSSEDSRSSFSGRGPKGFKRSDERIKEEVCEMLTRNHSIDADDIDVEVKDGEVTLTGSVSERRMKHLAEDLVEQCFGVKDVTNNIRVKKADYGETSDRTEFGSASRDRASASSTSSAQRKTTGTSTTSTTSKTPDNH